MQPKFGPLKKKKKNTSHMAQTLQQNKTQIKRYTEKYIEI